MASPSNPPLEQPVAIRVVGRRRQPPIGVPPSRETREALSRMADYRTRVPKGVFRYNSHEEANADRERWIVDAMVAAHGAEP